MELIGTGEAKVRSRCMRFESAVMIVWAVD